MVWKLLWGSFISEIDTVMLRNTKCHSYNSDHHQWSDDQTALQNDTLLSVSTFIDMKFSFVFLCVVRVAEDSGS